MLESKTFGNPETFAIRLEPPTNNGLFADVFIYVSGMVVNGQNPTYLSTFTAGIDQFCRVHRTPEHRDCDLSPEEEFTELRDVLTSQVDSHCFKVDDIWYYHYLYALDDAMVGCRMFVVDHADRKRLLYSKDIGENASLSGYAEIPRSTFLAVLDDFVRFAKSLSPEAYNGGTSNCKTESQQ